MYRLCLVLSVFIVPIWAGNSFAANDFLLKADGASYEDSILWQTGTSALGIGPGTGGWNASYNLHIERDGDASIMLQADTDNTYENNNPFLKMTQDGEAIKSIIGLVPGLGKDPENYSYTGTANNSFLLGTLASSSDTQLHLGTDGAVRLTIANNGNVGIGTTSPSYRLHVAGSVFAGGVVAGEVIVDETVFAQEFQFTESAGAVFDSDGQPRIWIDDDVSTILYDPTGSDQRIRIDSTQTQISSPSGYVAVAAKDTGVYIANEPLFLGDNPNVGSVDLCYDNSTLKVGHCTSLREYKQEIQPLRSGLATLAKLRPVTYRFKPEFGGYSEIGFIAEEVDEVDPRLTTRTKGELAGVRYKQLTALLTKAVMEQQAEIKELKAAIKQLQAPCLPESP